MGIRGLSTYLSLRDDFFTRTRLRNTKVIIDGSNLRFELYNECPGLNDCFGGDYDKYYRYVKKFFEQLLDCEITPIIILDGGRDCDGVFLSKKVRAITD